MDTYNQIISTLNRMLHSGSSEKELIEILKGFVDQFHPKIRVVDFVYYSEEKLKKAQQEKLIGVRTENFAWAAAQRDLETECQKHVDLRKQLNIQKSEFYFEKNYLIFYFNGSSAKEIYLKEYLTKI